jgi:hypothetical protein
MYYLSIFALHPAQRHTAQKTSKTQKGSLTCFRDLPRSKCLRIRARRECYWTHFHWQKSTLKHDHTFLPGPTKQKKVTLARVT